MGSLGDGGKNQAAAQWGATGLVALLCAALLVAVVNERFRSGWSPSVEVPDDAPALLRPVTIERVSEEAFRARLEEAGTQPLATLRACQRRLHQELGLLDDNLGGGPVTRFMTSGDHLPTAAYLPGRDTVLVFFKSPIATLHEWLHALEDQRGQRLSAMPGATTTDQRAALRAASEGFALARSGGLIPAYRSSRDLDGTLLRVSYSLGGAFFRARPINWEADLEYMPTTLGDLLGASMERETEGRLLPDGCTDRLGPAGILTLGGRTLPYHQDPLQFARLWVGDSAVMTYSDSRNASWVIWMRNTPDAMELLEAVRQGDNPKTTIVLVGPGT